MRTRFFKRYSDPSRVTMRALAHLLSVVFILAPISCVQMARDTLEYINPPVDLTVTQIAGSTYELSFYSDNREGGFVGYGVFVGVSASAVGAPPANDITAAAAFCSLSGQTNYQTRVTIQVGPSASGGTLCNFTSLALTSGQYVGLRSRIEREEDPWSQAAVALVP